MQRQRPSLDQVEFTISRRIAALNKDADQGSKTANLKKRAKASELSELLGWIRGGNRNYGEM